MASFLCRAILFDLDGTLVDSYPDADLCWTQWARSVGVTGNFEFAKLYGRRRSEIVRSLLPHSSPEEVTRHVEQVRLAEREYTSHVVPLPGARQLLSFLPMESWAIVTSNDREVAEARIHAAGLPMPRVLLSADEVERGKPDPEGLLLAASLLRTVPMDALAIDDSPVGIEAARRGGMPCIAVRFRHDDAALSKADAIVSNLSRLSIQQEHDDLVIRPID